MDWIRQILAKLLGFLTTDGVYPIIKYKIINETDDFYILQCTNSKTTIHASLNEITYDQNILYGLHPLQACFIGIEYSKLIRKNRCSLRPVKTPDSFSSPNISLCRSLYKIKYQDRKKNICYIDNSSNEEFTQSPKEIAFTDNLISNFSPAQAFIIGISAGLQIHSCEKNIVYFESEKKLKVI